MNDYLKKNYVFFGPNTFGIEKMAKYVRKIGG